MAVQRTAGQDSGRRPGRPGTVCRARIRPAQAGDAAAIAEMANALALLTAGVPGRMTAETVRRDLLGDRRLGCLVAEREDEAVGYVLWSAAYETAYAARGIYVSDLYVRPRHRRGGTGRALMRSVARICRGEGGRFVWWAVSPDNAVAQRFYDGLGAISDPVSARAVIDADFHALAEE